MFQTIHDRKQGRSWQLEHDARAPRMGELAPDF